MTDPIPGRPNNELVALVADGKRSDPVLVRNVALALVDERTENEKLRNVVNALTIAVRVTRAISEEKLQETIAIARGEEIASKEET